MCFLRLCLGVAEFYNIKLFLGDSLDQKKKCSSVCQIADRGPSAWMANYRWKRAGKQKQSLKGTLFRKELVSREAEEVKEGVVYAAGTDEFFCCGS